ncbi:hypothetical protein SDC9_140495 [bioreactor metagenome]|uniref:Uncharacterized protein n=1 Tax=bioreactor metagenome TaxID=1076179 RepID=A0A645DW51_9ZZZZ
MGLAATRFAPQVGRHGRAHIVVARAHRQAQMRQRLFIGPDEEPLERGARQQADIQRQLLHAITSQAPRAKARGRSAAVGAMTTDLGKSGMRRASGAMHRH